MNETKESSFSMMKKIILMMIILVIIMALGVVATSSNYNMVKIVFDDSEISVATSKVKVSEILNENKIVVLEDENVYPDMDSNIDISKTITITKKVKENEVITDEKVNNVTTQEILENYNTIVEKIVIEEEEIPFETITKDVSESDTETSDRVIQEGENGLKQVKYKIRYQNDEEIERTFISEEIIKEPVDKIIQIYTKITNRSAARAVQASETAEAVANSVEGIEPTVVTMNVSAYTASTCGKSASDPGYGITASGVAAKAWYTVAAGKGYPIGTVIYIPYFASQPNGGWFVVQDRGGAISNSRLDVYMDTYQECINFGRRNLECYVY